MLFRSAVVTDALGAPVLDALGNQIPIDFWLWGNAGNDIVTGDAGNDHLSGGLGNDTIDGGAGTDTARFAASVAGLTDGALVNVEAVEITNTGAGSYDLSGQSEALTVIGGAGADTITGGAGADRLLGNGGNDILIATAGDSLIDGGSGTDTARFAASVAGLSDAGLANVEAVEITSTGSGKIGRAHV